MLSICMYSIISTGFGYEDIKLKDLEQDHRLFIFFMLNAHISITETMTKALMELVSLFSM